MKRSRQIVTDTLHGYTTFLHRFKQSRLRLRRRAIDLISENDVGEDWTRDKLHPAMTGGAIFFDDLRTRDIGWHQIWSELNALEREVQDVGNGPHEQCFCEAGNAGDDRVATNEKCEQHLFDDFVLPDDRLSDFAQQALT